MYYDEMRSTELYEEESNADRNVKRIILIIFLAFLLLYAPVQYLGMHRLLEEHNLPEGAEVVLEPKVRMFECCGGCRLAIEEVYRVPVERTNSIPFGETYGQNGSLVVEPLGTEYGIEQTGISFRRNYESDCSYIYDYSDLVDMEGYQENDGYGYIHVWGRKRIGSESGLASILMCFSVLGPFIALPALLIVLVKDMIKWILKKKRGV